MGRNTNAKGHGRSKTRGGKSPDAITRERLGIGNGLFGFGPAAGRMPVIFSLMLVVVIVVIGRLFIVQVVKGPEYAAKALEHRKVTTEPLAKRGTIYDRRGNVLAKSEECYDVYCSKQELKKAGSVAKLLAKNLGGKADDYKELISDGDGYFRIAKQADKDACETLRKELTKAKLAGVHLEKQIRRVYPYGRVAGQIIGMLNDKGEGLTGLELKYNDVLSGTNGVESTEVGVSGIPIASVEGESTQAQDGSDLVLSIDIDVQSYMEQQVKSAVTENDATSGFAMAIDPHTGEILAACSTPYADLTDPGSLEDQKLTLKMVSDIYEPGSIFKVLTAAIALESGSMKTSDYYTIPPYVMVGASAVTDEDGRWEDTPMNLREMLRRSSNVAAAYFAQEHIGADTFAEGISKFGIGTMTGIDYPGEVAGIVKERSQYDGSSVGSMAFGQGLSIPMVQMVRAVGAIANGGTLRTPHFVTSVGGKATKWKDGSKAISKRTAQQVADMMSTVVKEGTATTAAVEGYEVAAKTGTGEQAENGVYVQDKYLASLIGFAPARDPQILLYVGLNETPYLAYSSAGPLFSAIMGEVLVDMGVLSSSQGL